MFCEANPRRFNIFLYKRDFSDKNTTHLKYVFLFLGGLLTARFGLATAAACAAKEKDRNDQNPDKAVIIKKIAKTIHK